MFFFQPQYFFGDLICDELESTAAGKPKWQNFEFAVAWVNQRGAEMIEASAKGFLARGGRIRASVGLDFGSSTYEGLSCLLGLEDGKADISTHVVCDEDQYCTFHPKVFLFSNSEEACLLVGSNNLTSGGLETNYEVSLGVTKPLCDDTIQSALGMLTTLRDDQNLPITRRLTRKLLEELRSRGYVRTEQEIRRDRQKSRVASGALKGPALFGRSKRPAKRSKRKVISPKSGGPHTTSSHPVEVLLMRVRPRRDGTQFQISMTVHKSPFMKEVNKLRSAADGSWRPIGHDHVKRNGKRVANLARFEAPELAKLVNPVARFKWVKGATAGGQAEKVLQYEIFDADSSAEGLSIFEKLQQGIGSPPVTHLEQLSHSETVLSKASPESAQWYRLDSV